MGGGDGEAAAQRPAPALGGAADRQHAALGADRAGGGARLDPVAARRGTSAPARTRRSRTPAASSCSRRPSASRAGCTVAEVGETAPARKAGDWQRSATSAALSGCSISGTPSSRQASHRPLPGAVVRGRGRDLHVAGGAEPGVDPLLLAEGADPRHRLLGRARRSPAPARRPSARASRRARTTSRCRSRRCGRSARARRPARTRAGRPAPRARSWRAYQAVHIPV